MQIVASVCLNARLEDQFLAVRSDSAPKQLVRGGIQEPLVEVGTDQEDIVGPAQEKTPIPQRPQVSSIVVLVPVRVCRHHLVAKIDDYRANLVTGVAGAAVWTAFQQYLRTVRIEGEQQVIGINKVQAQVDSLGEPVQRGHARIAQACEIDSRGR